MISTPPPPTPSTHQQRLKTLEILENENGHEKVMEHEKPAKSCTFVISHGIFPILPQITKKSGLFSESLPFPNAKSEQRRWL